MKVGWQKKGPAVVLFAIGAWLMTETAGGLLDASVFWIGIGLVAGASALMSVIHSR